MPENICCLLLEADDLFCTDFSVEPPLKKPFSLEETDGRTVVLFDYKELLKKSDAVWQINMENIFDCKLACYIFDPALDTSSLEKCAISLLKENINTENLSPAEILLEIYRFLSPAMAEKPIFRQLEMPLSPVLAAMEKRGITLDGKGLELFGSKLADEMETLTREIYAAAGREFNINSAKQLNILLFEELKLEPAGKKTKNAT